ncbi:hypothetical protein ACQ4PT_060206 [Festuca glaucescens]
MADPETKEHIRRTLEAGHVSYQVQLRINIPSGYERATEFVIVSANGYGYNLQSAENTPSNPSNIVDSPVPRSLVPLSLKWVQHLEDGSVTFIERARQPNYLVTADDVDTLLAIQVQSLDDRKRKGDVVKVYANNQAKITCVRKMEGLYNSKCVEWLLQNHSDDGSYDHAIFLDMWGPAVLAIKRDGYSIKCIGQHGVVLMENFQQATAINIPSGYERVTEFMIVSANGDEYNLQPAENMPPWDMIVLVLRLFRSMAAKKKRGWKKGLFFQ